MTELLPCPFCGGEAEKLTSIDGFTSIGCLNCNHIFGVMIQRSTEAEAIAAWNSRATGGTLTAEQVMAIAGKHQPDYCSDTHVCFDWQAIADELNSRAERTCHIEVHDNLAETEGMGDVWLECDECHWQMPLEPTTPRFKHCPNCGAKVVGE